MDKQLMTLWETFNNKAIENGYRISTHNNYHLGIGTTTYKDDAFVPIIQLSISEEYKIGKEVVSHANMCILVKDRNGNQILDGVFCGCYKLVKGMNNYDIKTDTFSTVYIEDFEERFVRMCDYVFEKWSKYSKDNRLDFNFNGLEQERMDWSTM